MSIKISCDCGKTAKVKDDLAGRKIKCPGCGAVVKVPGAKGESKRTSRVSKRTRTDELARDQSANVSSRLATFDSQRLMIQNVKQSAIQDVVFVKDVEERSHGDLVFSKNSLYYVQLGEGQLPPGGAENRPPGLQPKELTTKYPGSFKVKKRSIEEFRVAENGKFTIWCKQGRFAWYLPIKYKPVIELHLTSTNGDDDDDS